jgi:hypothetical protein
MFFAISGPGKNRRFSVFLTLLALIIYEKDVVLALHLPLFRGLCNAKLLLLDQHRLSI